MTTNPTPEPTKPAADIAVEAVLNRLMYLAGVMAHHACELAAAPYSKTAAIRHSQAHAQLKDALRAALARPQEVAVVTECKPKTAFTLADLNKLINSDSCDTTTASYAAAIVSKYAVLPWADHLWNEAMSGEEPTLTAFAKAVINRVDAASRAPVAVGVEPADPMDTPLPCDVTVGHGTMRKGVPLRSLVLRMKSLYEMATGNNADEVANRTPVERQALWDKSPLNLMNYEVGGRFKPKLSPEAQALSDQLNVHSATVPANHDATKLLENIYAFLVSVCPEGIADEAFRIVPDSLLSDSVRTKILSLHPVQGDTHGERVGLAGQDRQIGGRTDGAVVPAGVQGDAARLAHLADDAPFSQCTACGRRSWAESAPNNPCGMLQPDTSRCDGTMVAAQSTKGA